MVGRRPQYARRIVQITVALNVDRDAAVLLIGERRPNRSRRAVTDAICAVAADEMIRLVKIPQAQRPPTDERGIGDKRPVFFLDLIPDFGGEPRRADRAGIPTGGSQVEIAVPVPLVFLRQFLASFFHGPLAI